MRVSFDSNAWEAVFGLDELPCVMVREALWAGTIKGFVCETSFRIEAVRKQSRPGYFTRPKIGISAGAASDGKHLRLMFSISPDDSQHPGLPEIQRRRWQEARSAGVRLIHGLAWLGLPVPAEAREPSDFVAETVDQRNEREQKQALVSEAIWKRGVGKARFDNEGGWKAAEHIQANPTKFYKACAEWADGELAAAHIAYGNDILCTNDQGHTARVSVFNATNRAWLTDEYGVRFATLSELAELVHAKP